MTDLSEYTRLADAIVASGHRADLEPEEQMMIEDALRFHANASEEVIERALLRFKLAHPYIEDQMPVSQARDVLAALEGRKP